MGCASSLPPTHHASMLITFDPSYELAPVPSGVAVDKVAKFKWPHPGEVGEYQLIHKSLLGIDRTYQRKDEHKEIAREFNWQLFGAINVMQRVDGSYVVVEGQQRTLAAWSRSDVQEIPCMVHRSNGVHHEAEVFYKINTHRKAVAAFDKFKAKLVANDETAQLISQSLAARGLKISPDGDAPMTLTCVAACERLIGHGTDHFDAVIDMAASLAKDANVNVSQVLIGGLSVIHRRVGKGLGDEKLAEKLRKVGARALVERAKQKSLELSKGGEKVWAQGMLDVVNQITRGRKKFAAGPEAQA